MSPTQSKLLEYCAKTCCVTVKQFLGDMEKNAGGWFACLDEGLSAIWKELPVEAQWLAYLISDKESIAESDRIERDLGD
jgi:hypothetical protein